MVCAANRTVNEPYSGAWRILTEKVSLFTNFEAQNNLPKRSTCASLANLDLAMPCRAAPMIFLQARLVYIGDGVPYCR